MQLPRVRAPQLPDDPALWRHAGGAAAALAPNRVYLLDFWTFGCINCLHVLPDLAHFEATFGPRGLHVIGVHSGKFPHERGEAIDAAIARLGIAHPVLADDDYDIWRRYGIRAWPTLVLIDADGYVVGAISGEGHREVVAETIEALLAGYEAQGRSLTPAPAPTPPQRRAPGLRFPGKLLADPDRARFFVADTGNGRIVEMPWEGEGACRTLGEGALSSPQGMALSPDGGALFVADAGSHTILSIDIASGAVAVRAGTGRQRPGPLCPGPAHETDLNSPWDLCLAPDGAALFVALAGAHQIGRLDLRTEVLTPWAGTGREARVDGAPDQACLAQPSGLTTDGATLFVADAESSSIRAIDLATRQVTTLAGGDLFDFGHRDGVGTAARFQHPLGVAWDAGALYVADTYNHAVRAVDPGTGRVATLPIPETLHEPSGLAARGGVLLLADTGAHRIVAFDTIMKSTRIREIAL